MISMFIRHGMHSKCYRIFQTLTLGERNGLQNRGIKKKKKKKKIKEGDEPIRVRNWLCMAGDGVGMRGEGLGRR